MSEGANGAPMNYVRLWLADTRRWVGDAWIVSGGPAVGVAFAESETTARIFIDPSTITTALRENDFKIETHPATFAEWIDQREPSG